MLFLTEKTVENHPSRAYRKLGIRSRWQLGEFVAGAEPEAVGAR
jgi:DNA-binding NarL/FixJ family response regulator